MNRFIEEDYRAYFAGKKEHNNPYVKDSRKHRDWLTGFESAKEEDEGNE